MIEGLSISNLQNLKKYVSSWASVSFRNMRMFFDAMLATRCKLMVHAYAGDEAAPEACSTLLAAVSNTTAMPLALRSLVSNPPSLQIAPIAANPADSQNQPQLAPQAQSAEQQKHAMLIQMTMHAVLRPLTAHVPASSASPSGRVFRASLLLRL